MSYFAKTAFVLASLTSVSAVSAAPGSMDLIFDGQFDRFPAVREKGRSVAAHCQIDGSPAENHWDAATGSLRVFQGSTASKVEISVENARPDTLFTVWLMLAGGSPMMEAGATALIPSSALPAFAAMVDAPSNEATNGFMTDENGNGSLTLELDYTIVGGAFPFQRFEGFDAENTVFTREAPKAVPVAISDASTGAPFTLRLASHCGDNLHNGLVAGQHEPWFDWLAD